MIVIFDVLAIAAGNGYWSEIAHWMITAGCSITGLLAAPFGFIDWLAIRAGTRAKRIGAVHGLGNVVVLLMFAGSWLLRGTLRERPFRPRLRCRSWPALSPCLPAGSEASSWTASRSASTMAPTLTRQARCQRVVCVRERMGAFGLHSSEGSDHV
jgi:hypothetical protein